MHRLAAALACASIVALAAAPPAAPFALDRAGEQWVVQTKARLTLDQKIGQLIVPSFESGYISIDSDLFDQVSRLVREYHVGGFHVFGASQPAPSVLLNSG